MTVNSLAAIELKKEHVERDPPVAAAGKALSDRSELAVIAFERTRMPMVMTDARQADHPIILANRSFLQLTGYSAEEVIGRNCRFLQGEGTSAVAIAEISAGIRHGREVDVELLNSRKNGESFWNQLHLSPIHDEAGSIIYYFGSQLDVTKYRDVQALEASEHRLLMEVDHRAKNVLALVDSVVRLSKADNARRYAASVQHRVQSLSRAHALLAEHRWSPVFLRDVVGVQLQGTDTDRVQMSGPPLPITPTLVQPLSLVFHEMMRNSVEHGALSVRQGQLLIEWNANGGRGFRLICSDRNGPPTHEPTQRGFGLVIADALIERQLLGTVHRDWLPSGLVTQMALP